MRGIDLYKAILDGETKYEGKRFKFVYQDEIDTSIHVDKEQLKCEGIDLFMALSPTRINIFMRTELDEVIIPMPWQECIQQWAQNHNKYIIKIETDNETALYGQWAFGHLQDENRYGIAFDEILNGKWYLIEK